MKVFKFGGASIKDASSIKNILKIISSYNDDKLIIVVSAMGKTTNALEIIVDNYFNNKPELQSSILDVFNFHSEIMMDLFKKNDCDFELMHCVSTYPMKEEDANLKVIETLKKRYNCNVGYSGHESSLLKVAILAASLGATSIERHVTLDRAMYGSDQAASITSDTLKNF